MGHAHHFLSRLDRLALPQVELALSLYNDVALLQYILGQTRVPENAERVAISLDDRKEGPFLIVTRDGRFVTCLGTGMSPGEWPIVTRGQLDALSARVSDLRERMEVCRKLVGPKGGAGQIINRIFEAGEELSREDFLAYSALQPLFGVEFLRIHCALSNDLNDARQRILPGLRKSSKLHPVWHDALRAYDKAFWALGHFTVLAAMSGPALLEDYPEARETMLSAPLSWPLTRQGISTLAIKGAWCVGRIGKAYMPTYKRFLDEASTPYKILTSMMGLATLGLRHTRLRAEAQKAITSPSCIDPEDTLAPIAHPYHTAVSKTLEVCFEFPEEALARHLEFGREMCVAQSAYVPEGSPHRYARVEDVPEDLALRVTVNTIQNLIDRPHSIKYTLLTMPWVAKAAPEDLYLPRDYIRTFRSRWRPEDTYLLLEPFIKAEERARQLALAEKIEKKNEPTRNGPCPCGSGKKYKRCCGAG